MPLCLSSVQFLQLTTKEHKHGLQNDADNDDAGLQGRQMSQVTIVIDSNAATATIDDDDMDPSVMMGVTTKTAIPLQTAPVNVTIS